MNEVTACLITWKRQYNIPIIYEHLLKHPYISEIILIDNSKGDNDYTSARYKAAKRAKNNYIYTQDDDCLVHNMDEIYNKFLEDPATAVHGGTIEYSRIIAENIHADCQLALFGWGAFFDKRWVGVLDEYTNKYGEDYCYKRECDRIFTMLLRKKHNFVVADLEHLDGYNDGNAMCNQNDHVEYKNMAIERVLSL